MADSRFTPNKPPAIAGHSLRMPEKVVDMNFNTDSFDTYYEVGEELGSGQFAVVRRCVHRVSGVAYAAKFIKKRRFNSSRRGVQRSDIEREISVLRDVGGHENVISLHEVYETPLTVILILQLVSGGELFDHVCERERLCEAEASTFIRQILKGVQHLHCRHIVHLDLKPENVMLLSRKSTQIKLIDFGLSRKILPGAKIKDMIGTPEFVAPEIVNYDYLSNATDMWAVGVISYILLSGASPFLGANRDDTFCNITAVAYQFDDFYFEHTSELAKDFIRRLFVKNPRKRASVEECLKHPWIEPAAVEQEALRQEAAVNISNIKRFHIRRRWRNAIHAVMMCNRLVHKAKIRAAEAKRGKKERKSVSMDTAGQEPSFYNPENLSISALMCASEEGNVSGLEQLLQTSHIDVNTSNELGETGIHVAAGAGQVDMVRFLVLKGSKPDVIDKHGDSPLYWAARHGSPDVIRFLYDEGADLDRQNKCNETALHAAVRYSQTEAVKQLCGLGSNVNVQDEHGETPIHVASWQGGTSSHHILQIICNGNADLGIPNWDSETALHCAAARGHLECVQTLLDSGTPLDHQDKSGQTPLHLALRRQHLDIALLLLTKGCRLDIQDEKGDLPLHIACKEGLLTAVQSLCHLGSPLDLLNTSSLCSLHVAAKEGHIEIVRCLCLSGCAITTKNKDGLSAEIMALAQGNTQIGDLLSRLKSDQQKDIFADQLYPSQQPLKRVKLKFLGHSNVGKTKLGGALQTGVIGSFLGGLRRWSEGGSSNGRDDSSDLGPSPKTLNTLDQQPTHSGYTRGIEVQNVNISGSGEFSLWEFPGYQPYHQVYDHFVGNADCIHVILFRVTDSTEIQYQQVVYWLNFLKGRVMPSEPIGHCGALGRRLKVVLVATHADQVNPALPKNSEGEFVSSDADALLKTVCHRFCSDFDIHDKLILVNGLQPNCAGIKGLKAYLNSARSAILENLPKTTGFLDMTINYLQTLRRQEGTFPVVTWPVFVQMVRNEVNPLAGELHCRQLIQQLQLMGEVVYLKGDATDLDYVIISPEWLCTGVIGHLLSAEFLRKCRPTGVYTAEEFFLCFPDVPEIVDLLQILDALQLCTQCDLDGDLEYEFPSFNFLYAPPDIWEPSTTASSSSYIYGGLRIQAQHGMEQSLASVFPRLQVQLRRSMQEFQDPVDAELIQWSGCSKMCSGQMEGLITLVPREHSRQDAIEIQVRGPSELASSSFYFMEDLAQLAEQTVTEVAPGLPLERHFLSPKDLQRHSASPAIYPPDAVMEMQHKESLSLKNNQEGEEPFTDVVCFGSREVAMVLTLGIDLPVAQLQLAARRELAVLLDPQHSMGKDWSILAVRLGLTEQLPEVDSTGTVLSNTDQLLAEWALRDPVKATVGTLSQVLRELGREDAVTALFKLVPLYLFVPLEETPLPQSPQTDSGLASTTHSYTTSATSQRSSSTLSR